jgi:hypothetical protein
VSGVCVAGGVLVGMPTVLRLEVVLVGDWLVLEISASVGVPVGVAVGSPLVPQRSQWTSHPTLISSHVQFNVAQTKY